MRLSCCRFARKSSGSSSGWAGAAGATVLVLVFFAFPVSAQESQSQDPPSVPDAAAVEEQTPEPAEPPEEASPDPDDERISIDDLKALSDADLRALYLEEPWRLPEDFGDDAELLERVMSLVHPEMDPESETTEHPEPTGPEETAETTPKPKPQPDAR